MLREELVEGFAPADDRPTQRDGVRLACERPGAGFPGLLVPDAAVPIRIVLPVLEQRSVRFQSLPARLTHRRPGTFHRARRYHRAVQVRRLDRQRLERRPRRRRDRYRRRQARRGDRLLRGPFHARVIDLTPG